MEGACLHCTLSVDGATQGINNVDNVSTMYFNART